MGPGRYIELWCSDNKYTAAMRMHERICIPALSKAYEMSHRQSMGNLLNKSIDFEDPWGNDAFDGFAFPECTIIHAYIQHE